MRFCSRWKGLRRDGKEGNKKRRNKWEGKGKGISAIDKLLLYVHTQIYLLYSYSLSFLLTEASR